MEDILMLKLRSAVADKEWAIACANMDLETKGFWSCDWNNMMSNAQREIDDCIGQIEFIRRSTSADGKGK